MIPVSIPPTFEAKSCDLTRPFHNQGADLQLSIPARGGEDLQQQKHVELEPKYPIPSHMRREKDDLSLICTRAERKTETMVLESQLLVVMCPTPFCETRLHDRRSLIWPDSKSTSAQKISR